MEALTKLLNDVKNMPLNIKRSDRGTTEPASNGVSHDDHFEGVSL